MKQFQLLLLPGLILALADAQAPAIPDCTAVPFPTPIGFKCVERKPLRAQNGQDSITSTFSADWVVLTTNWLEESRYGDASGPNIQQFTSNTVANVKSSWSVFNSQLNEYDARAKLPDPETGQPVEASLYQKEREEFKRKFDTLIQVSTNVSYVSASASASRRCKTRVLGACVDYQGGSLTGILEIYKMYIGSPEAAKAEYSTIADRGDRLPLRVKFTNNCHEDVQVAFAWGSNSKATGWWTARANSYIFPVDNDLKLTLTESSPLYYYAKSKSHVWSGASVRSLNGSSLGMRIFNYKKDGINASGSINCKSN